MGKHIVSNDHNQVSDQALTVKVESLSKEMQPQRDLWAGIERAIQHKEQEPYRKNSALSGKKAFVPMAWAASVIAAVLLSWHSFTPLTELLTEGALVNNQSSDKKAISGSQLVAMMQVGFTQQKKAMLVSFGQPNIKNLPVKMQNQLKILEHARVAIEEALLNDVNNVELLNLLRFTQQQELNLLEQLSPYMNDSSWHTI
jgi:hypothetical protein